MVSTRKIKSYPSFGPHGQLPTTYDSSPTPNRSRFLLILIQAMTMTATLHCSQGGVPSPSTSSRKQVVTDNVEALPAGRGRQTAPRRYHLHRRSQCPCASELRLMVVRCLVITVRSEVDQRCQGSVICADVVDILTRVNGDRQLTVNHPCPPPPQEAHGHDRHAKIRDRAPEATRGREGSTMQ